MTIYAFICNGRISIEHLYVDRDKAVKWFASLDADESAGVRAVTIDLNDVSIQDGH